MKKNLLSIRLYGEQVGILEQNLEGQKIFTYDPTAVMPLSVGMPIRKEPYQELPCEAFFGGLLPESEIAKKIIGKKYGVSSQNSFSLLRAIGYDCAGAISCHEIKEPIKPTYSAPLSGRVVREEELYEHIINLPRNPLFLDVEGLRLSLAGVQEKAAICLIEGQIAFPENGCPTTHILKPPSNHFEGMPENEYFILKVAKRVGLPVSEVILKKVNDITFLLIERYDRRIHKKEIERLHQEDFCQALGVPSYRKYQNEGGPSLESCFELLKNTAQPAINRNTLVSAVIFNYLVGNMDAHGKNFSLIHDKGGSQIMLAPFYDIVCTRVYDDLTSKMAMKIGNKYDASAVLPRHWQQFCENINYRYLALKKIVGVLADKIKAAMIEEEEQLKTMSFYHPIINKIKETVNRNIDQTLKKF